MLELSWHWEHQILLLLWQHSEDFHYSFIFQDFKETLVLGVPHSLGCWFWHLCQMCRESQKIINRVDWQSAWVNEKNVKYKNIWTLAHSTASTLLASPHPRGGSTVNESPAKRKTPVSWEHWISTTFCPRLKCDLAKATNYWKNSDKQTREK